MLRGGMRELFMGRVVREDLPAAAAKSLQSCPILCDHRDGSPPGSSVPGILQARTLEWVAISFSSAWKWKVKVKSLSCVRLLATPWTVAHQAPPSMGFSRQEHWSGAPLPSPRSPWGGDIWAVVWVKRPAVWDMGKSVLREGTSSGKAQRMSLGCLRNSRKARVAGTERTGKEQKWYG